MNDSPETQTPSMAFSGHTPHHGDKSAPSPGIPIVMGIRQKLALAFSLIIILVMTLTVYIVTSQQEQESLTRARRTALIMGRLIELGMGEDIVRGNFQGLEYNLGEIDRLPNMEYCLIQNESGKIIASTEPNATGRVFADEWSRAGLFSTSVELRRALFKKNPVYDISVPVNIGGQRFGVIRLGFSLAEEIEYIRRLLFFNLTLGLVFIIIGIVTAFLLSSSFLAPISRLLDATRQISSGNFNWRSDIATADEFQMLGTSFNSMTVELQKKEQLRKYVSQGAWEEVEKTEGKLVRAGYRDDIAVLFSDVQGFTSFSEKHEPEEVVEYLNGFFNFMVAAVREFGGSVDKFIGDCIMGVFTKSGTHHWTQEQRAMFAALNMKFNLKKFNHGQALLGLEEFQTGIGITAGPVVLGNMGSKDRMEYTVLGDTVNLASRLEGESRNGSITNIFVSRAMVDRNQGLFTFRLVGEKKIKGKQEGVEIFELEFLTDLTQLEQNLFNGTSEEKKEALKILSLSRNEKAVSIIRRYAVDGDSLRETAAIKALDGFAAAHHRETLDFLLGMVRSSRDPLVISSAVATLGFSRNPEMAPLFTELLSHYDSRVRASALEGLIPLDFPDKETVYRKYLKDPDGRVAANALIGLWPLENREALSQMLEMLYAKPQMAASSAFAIGVLAGSRKFRLSFGPEVAETSPEISYFSGRILEQLIKLLRLEGASGRKFAARALGNLALIDTLPDLETLLATESNPEVVTEIEQALERLHSLVPG